MKVYPFSPEENGEHPWDEINYLQEYICSTGKAGSHEITSYMDKFETHLQTLLNFTVDCKLAELTSDVALDRMVLRYLVKHLDWISKITDFINQTLSDVIVNYDISNAAIEPILEHDYSTIWRNNQKRIAQRGAQERRVDENVLARMTANSKNNIPVPDKTKVRRRRQSPKK
ncbi:hypothetical protein ACFQ12_10220 [Methylobacterium trifolii]